MCHDFVEMELAYLVNRVYSQNTSYDLLGINNPCVTYVYIIKHSTDAKINIVVSPHRERGHYQIVCVKSQCVYRLASVLCLQAIPQYLFEITSDRDTCKLETHVNNCATKN